MEPDAGPRYVYGIIRAKQRLDLGPVGIGGAAVTTVHCGDLAAISSSAPRGRLDVLRHARAHADVLERVMEEHDVLPMQFGSVALSRGEVKAFLQANEDRLAQTLDRIHGKVEVGVKLLWRESLAIERLRESDGSLRALAEREAGKLDYSQLVAAGRAVKDALDAWGREIAAEALGALAPFASDHKVDRNLGSAMFLNVALLAERHRIPEIETALEALDARHGDVVCVKLVTSPPYSFVRLEGVE